MSTRLMAVAIGVALGFVALSLPSTADARVCKARISGEGAGIGLAGLGTENARAEARGNWEASARKRFGSRFASLSKASATRWDCRSGMVLQVKCVVTARPCR